MQSSDRGHFFETNVSQAERVRKAAKAGNRHGNPLEMKSKILAATHDATLPNSSIFIAESAGFVRRVRLDSSKTQTTYRGPKAPVTCVALGGKDNKTVFAGSWDKDIWTWDVESAEPGRRHSGHTDFVKSVICTRLGGKHVLVSGGADKKIIVWDIATGSRLHTIQDAATNMLAIQHLTLDPILSTPDEMLLVSASSDPHIRRWQVTLDKYKLIAESSHNGPNNQRPTIAEHDTSVYRLLFDVDGADVDLWTASADGTAKCLARSRNFAADETYTHGNYVRAVQLTEHWIFTAGRDEDIKIWNRATGKLYCTMEGHYEEITDLVLLRNVRGVPDKICSVSIDRTIRTWPVQKEDLDRLVKEIRESKEAEAEAEADVHQESVGGQDLLTAEEEAELAELMGD